MGAIARRCVLAIVLLVMQNALTLLLRRPYQASLAWRLQALSRLEYVSLAYIVINETRTTIGWRTTGSSAPCWWLCASCASSVHTFETSSKRGGNRATSPPGVACSSSGPICSALCRSLRPNVLVEDSRLVRHRFRQNGRNPRLPLRQRVRPGRRRSLVAFPLRSQPRAVGGSRRGSSRRESRRSPRDRFRPGEDPNHNLDPRLGSAKPRGRGEAR